MKTRIGAIAAVAAVALATTLSIAVMAPSAGAATTTPSSPGVRVHSIAAPAITKPSTSPSITAVNVVVASTSQCSSGFLCAYVPTGPGGTWWEFKFFHCLRYSLSNFFDSGFDESIVIDDQTGGVTTTYFGQSGNVLQTMKPAAGRFQSVLPGRGGWDPVFSIKVC